MKIILSTVISVFVLFSSQSAPALEDGDYVNTIERFQSYEAVKPFFNNSYGYAVFPLVGKAGFVVGGSYGEGRVYANGQLTGSTSVIEGSIGWQAGGKAFSEILFFQDKRAYDEFTAGNFEFDATAQAIVVTAAVEVEAGTTGTSAGAAAGPKTVVLADSAYHKGIASFVHPQGGLMYEFSLGGQRFTFSPLHQ